MLDPSKKLFRWGPISACPLFMYFTVEPSFRPLKKLFGVCYPFSHVIFKDNKVTWLLDTDQFTANSRKFVALNVRDKKKFGKYMREWNRRTALLGDALLKLHTIELSALKDDALVSFYSEFMQIYYAWWVCTMSVELVTVTIEPELGSKLKEYYEDKDEREYNKAFAILSSPLDLTFYRREQRDLIKILTLDKKDRLKYLKKHQADYYWMYNSYYEGKVLDFDYFKEELKRYEENKKDSLSILTEIERYSNKIKEDKEVIYEEIKPTKDFKNLVSLVEKFSTLQDNRKEYNFKAEHFLELFVGEFARRSKNKVADLKYLLPKELPESILKVNKSLLKAREECLVFNFSEKEMGELRGKEALTIHKLFNKVADTEQSMLHGILASTGDLHYFRGVARLILSVNDMDKLGNGDILVTTMTSPDFVIGMKRAGAIVTDTGGILCHAAIVSREFKKPCIVGTEVATKVIKDGDIIELHCARGTIKIIKS